MAKSATENSDSKSDDNSQLTRPRTVGDCRGGPRPCPFVSCRFNLLMDVDDRGNITLNVPKIGRKGFGGLWHLLVERHARLFTRLGKRE